MAEQRVTRGIVIILISSLFFSMMGATVKFTAATLPPMEVVFVRALLNFLIVLPLVLNGNHSFFGNNKKLIVTRSVAGFIALSSGFYVTAHLSLADSAILNQTSVLFVALFSFTVLAEPPVRSLVFLTILGFVGSIFVVKPGYGVTSTYGLVGLLGGACAATAYLSIKKLHATDSYLTIVLNFSLYSTVLSLLLFAHQFRIPTFYESLGLLGVGMFGSGAQLMLTKAFQYGEASVISPFIFSGVIFSGIWGAIFWKEYPDTLSVLGASIIILAGIGILRISRK